MMLDYPTMSKTAIHNRELPCPKCQQGQASENLIYMMATRYLLYIGLYKIKVFISVCTVPLPLPSAPHPLLPLSSSLILVHSQQSWDARPAPALGCLCQMFTLLETIFSPGIWITNPFSPFKSVFRCDLLREAYLDYLKLHPPIPIDIHTRILLISSVLFLLFSMALNPSEHTVYLHIIFIGYWLFLC